MDWRVVGVGGVLGVVLFGVAAYQVLDAIWPRTPALSRADAEVDARWTALEPRFRGEIVPETSPDALLAVMDRVGAVPDDETVPIEVSGALAEVLDGGASVPHYGCTGLPIEVTAGRHLSPYDWVAAAEGLVDIGRADLALRVAAELRDDQDLIPYAIGLQIHSVTAATAPGTPRMVSPTPSGLADSVIHAARCADATLATFDWDEAEDFFGQDRVPPRWWYDPAADRRALRDYYVRLIDAIEPHRSDASAMSTAIEQLGSTPHPAQTALVSRILTTGHLSMLRGFLAEIEAVQDAG
ncbi:MAG: hypothetical protein AAF211_15080 [Myxococcota bacterium]